MKFREEICTGSGERPLGLPFNQMGVIGLFAVCPVCDRTTSAVAGENGYAHNYRVARHRVCVPATRYAVSCEYRIEGETCAVTHLRDHDGQTIGDDYDRAERFASIQTGDWQCTGSQVVAAA